MFKFSLVLLALIFLSAARGAVHFDCTFSMFTAKVIGNVYTCEPIVTIVGDSQILESVLGKHEIDKTNADVKFLWVWYQNLPFIPENITNFFGNLIGLSWQSSNLATISTAHLEPFPNLLYFYAYGNKLISIDGDLFQHNPKLQYINFFSNEIQHVGHDLVKNLDDLVTLYFDNNPCVDTNAINNRTAVLWLNEQLPIWCPPTTTTTTEQTTTEKNQECPYACQERMVAFEVKISELSGQNVDLKATVNRQGDQIRELAKRLAELEAIVKV